MRNVSTSERLRIGAPAFAWLRTGVRWTTGGGVLFAGFAGARGASAQISDNSQAESALFHFGLFDLTPSISVNNVGRDENVFNEAQNARGDTTATFIPALNFWGRLGRSRLRGRTAGQYLYYSQYTNQRGWSSQNE